MDALYVLLTVALLVLTLQLIRWFGRM